MEQVIQLAGAIMVLTGFIGAQVGRMTPQARSYLVLNLVGSVLLLVTAVADGDAGFILLEGVWAAAAIYGLVRPAAADSP